MELMYLLACIPAIVGACFWIKSKEVVWFEWLIGTALAFAVSGIVHGLTVMSMTADVEIWSGQVTGVDHEPYWHATWTEQETYYVTVGSGNNRRQVARTRTVTKTKTHHPEWNVTTNIGRFSIDESKYNHLKKLWGKEESRRGRRHHGFDRGDRNDYFLVNKNKWIEPVTANRNWTNRVQAAPSAFSFPKVPEGTPVHPYPTTNNRFRSDRLLGRANAIKTLKFDQMMARLGPMKQVNIIIIGFDQQSDSSIAHQQEAHWIGGKKNDLVLCYGGGDSIATAGWSYVFGWSEEELVKRNLETILLNSKIDDSILPLIAEEVMQNYKIKDWSKFDYLSIEPPLQAYIWLIVAMTISQSVLWFFFHRNDITKA